MDSQQAIAIVLFITAFCSYINYKFLKLPKSIGITIVALVISAFINLLSIIYEPINDYALLMHQNLGFNHTFLHGMLSFLLFAAAIQINPRELSKHKLSISCFATISVIISTLLIGYATYGISLLSGLDLPISYCFIFGALISPTDAISVTNVLRALKMPKYLEMKISGEALFNDGMAIVLFILALALTNRNHESIQAGEAFLYFLREGVGGIVFGLIIGWISVKLFKSIDDSELIIMLTLVLVTGGYFIANSALQVSGPITMALAGLIIGANLKRNELSNAAIRHVEDFWILIDELLNAILFVLIGIEFIWIDITIPIIISSVAAVIITLGARWISLYIPELIVAKGHKLNNAVITLMTWCGLRGGISVALALGLPGSNGEKIVAVTYFVVLFSIIVQGFTIKPLLKRTAKLVTA